MSRFNIRSSRVLSEFRKASSRTLLFYKFTLRFNVTVTTLRNIKRRQSSFSKIRINRILNKRNMDRCCVDTYVESLTEHRYYKEGLSDYKHRITHHNFEPVTCTVEDRKQRRKYYDI